MIKIGIAEDDIKIASLLKFSLEENDFEVLTIANGSEALTVFTDRDFDLLIVDVMMPGINGHQLCQKIRAFNQQIPILMITALGMVNDKVLGLESGADDYLVKPFHLQELIARVNALLRRTNNNGQKQVHLLCFEDLCLDTYSKEVTRNNKPIDLSAKEYLLLEFFLSNPNRLLSRQLITEKVWDINFDTGTNVIDVYVNFLRKKIDKNFERKLIQTRPGLGFIFTKS